MTRNDLPPDADGDAIWRVVQTGSDLSRPMIVEFNLVASDEEAARKVAAAVATQGFEIQCIPSGERWTCICSRSMLLIHADLQRIQENLDAIGRPYGGSINGWGTFGNK
jgi:regulator of RNase E activity RraB